MFKDASLEERTLLKDYDPTVWGEIRIFLRQAWPPTRTLKILKCWQEAPEKAIELGNQFHKNPRFIVIGHTHKPDITRIGSTTVINTGSFLPWPGAIALDLDSDGLTVRKIIARSGRFSTDHIISHFEVPIDLDSLTIPNDTSSKTQRSTEQTISV